MTQCRTRNKMISTKLERWRLASAPALGLWLTQGARRSGGGASTRSYDADVVMSSVVDWILICAWLYSALEASVNSICIILYISTLVVVIVTRTTTKASTYCNERHESHDSARSRYSHGTLSGSDWLRPRFKDQVKRNDLRTLPAVVDSLLHGPKWRNRPLNAGDRHSHTADTRHSFAQYYAMSHRPAAEPTRGAL